MCGRYNIITDAEALVDAFQILSSDLDFSTLQSQYNISPSKVGAPAAEMHKAPIIRVNNGTVECINAVWPLLPVWAKGQVPKYATANARAESMKTANSYKHAWSHQQRCLVPASGFYEWQVLDEGGPKQPYNIQVKSHPIFAMAGLWESSSDGSNTIESFTIITTEANSLMAEIHNSKQRMPVILSPALYKTWLEGSSTAAESCVKSFPAEQMQAYKISRKVNNPQYNEADILAPLQ